MINCENFQKNRSKYYIVALVLLTLGILTKGITQGEFWFPDASRHAMDGVFVLDLIKDFPVFHLYDYATQYYTKYPALGIGYYPPFFAIVEALFFGLFGISVFSARLTVVFFAVIGVIFWFKLIKLVYDEKTAFYSSLLFISTPFIVKWSRSVMLEMPALAMVIVSVYFFFNFIEHNKKRHGWYFILSIALAILTKQTAVFLIPVFFLYVIFTKKLKKLSNRKILLISIGLLLLLLPLAVFILKLGGMVFIRSIGSLTDHSRLLTAKQWYFYPGALVKVLTLPVLILSVISIAVLFFKKELRKSTLFLSWLLGFYIVFTYIVAQETRYSFFWVPPFTLFATLAIHKIPWRVKGIPLASIFIISLCVYQFYLVVNQKTPFVAGFEEAARYTSEKPEKTVFFQGSARGNGNFIFHSRQLDKDRKLVVLRGDKTLASSAVSPHLLLVEHVNNREEVYDILAAYGSKYFLIEEKTDYDIAAFMLLRDVLASEDFTLIKKINLASVSFTQPANGTVNAMDPGTFIYMPTPDFTGMDVFTYNVTDKDGIVVSASVIIFVLDHSDPLALEDRSVTAVNTPVTIYMLQNDRKGSWVGSTFTQPPNGTVSYAGNERDFIYTPNPNFTGKDSFTYTLIDKHYMPHTAPVTIEVVNHTGSVAMDDIYATPANTPVNIYALDNDRPDLLKGQSILVYKFNRETSLKRDFIHMRLPIIGREITVPLKTLSDFYTPSNSALPPHGLAEEPVSD